MVPPRMPRRIIKTGDRESLNLSVNKDLKRQMKIEALNEGEDLSEITERLYLEFLRRKKVRIPKSKKTTAVGKLSKTDSSERKIGFLSKRQAVCDMEPTFDDFLTANGV